jgi:hypothetical protein
MLLLPLLKVANLATGVVYFGTARRQFITVVVIAFI